MGMGSEDPADTIVTSPSRPLQDKYQSCINLASITRNWISHLRRSFLPFPDSIPHFTMLSSFSDHQQQIGKTEAQRGEANILEVAQRQSRD